MIDEEDNAKTRIVNMYDEKGNITGALKYNDADQLVEKVIYEVDDNNRVYRVVEENQHHKTETILNYDSGGNVVEQQEINEKGELNHRILRKFDEENNLVESEVEINREDIDVSQNYLMHYKYEFFG